MAILPKDLLDSLKGIEGFDKESFERVHAEHGRVTSIRVNPGKTAGNKQWVIGNRQSSIEDPPVSPPMSDVSRPEAPIYHSPFTIHNKVPWSRYGYYLSQRPSFTFDPLFHGGLYYVQEASSMFLEQALTQLADLTKPLKVLDLCAAPGGKSTHIQSLISPDSLLVSNEVIRGRSNVLTDNIIKWGCNNVIVTSADPAVFQKLAGYFDIIVADAPCSGSGLFRRDEESINEWSLNNVRLCCQRQQRILADVLPALKENGLLIYSTCSYSREEDEDVADWLVTEFNMNNESLEIQKDWGITVTESATTKSAGYRFYPDKVKGEGFFLSCFRKTDASKEHKIRPSTTERVTNNEREILKPWLEKAPVEIMKEGASFFILPDVLTDDYLTVKAALKIHYFGTNLGKIMKNKLVPDHSLALSTIVGNAVPVNDLDYEESIRYLQKQDVIIPIKQPGWQLIRYQKLNLGWINVLPGRINNYYPKELRILKRQNDSGFGK